MLIVYLRNGRMAELPTAVDVKFGQLHLGADTNAPVEQGVHCYDSDGALVGLFLYSEVAGYAITERGPTAEFFSTTSEQQ